MGAGTRGIQDNTVLLSASCCFPCAFASAIFFLDSFDLSFSKLLEILFSFPLMQYGGGDSALGTSDLALVTAAIGVLFFFGCYALIRLFNIFKD